MKYQREQDRENDPLADIFDADGMSKSPRRPADQLKPKSRVIEYRRIHISGNFGIFLT